MGEVAIDTQIIQLVPGTAGYCGCTASKYCTILIKFKNNGLVPVRTIVDGKKRTIRIG